MREENIIVVIVGIVAIAAIASLILASTSGGLDTNTSDSAGQAYTGDVAAQKYFCSDSDGIDYSIQGTTYGYPISGDGNYYLTDACLDNGKSLIEYYCSNGKAYSEMHQCNCINGACAGG